MAYQPKGLINLRVGTSFEIKPVGNLRVPKGGDESGKRPGTFRAGGPQDQIRINTQYADVIQAAVVERMQRRISGGKRASASTGRLVNVTASSRNRRVERFYVGVGLPDYLDKSEAKYWRTFEEGSKGLWKRPFIGTKLFGMKKAPYPVAHYATPGLRTMTEGRMQELQKKFGDNSRSRDVLAGRPRRGDRGKFFTVKREIAPSNIYRDVALQHRDLVRDMSLQYAQRVLREAFREIVVAGRDFKPPPI